MAGKDLEKIYRPSSTLIVVAKSSSNDDFFNYRLLLTKRSATVEFAPDHYVFPGGVFDAKADANIEWLKHFETFGICRDDLDILCLQHLSNRPKPLMTSGVNFSRDISLRITAIREAFEEVGLLLCLKRNDLKSIRKSRESYLHDFDRSYWQRKVHNNAMEFLNLCKHMDVVPDLWSLQEWSIWRSPPTSGRKYDTAIYIVSLKNQPDLILEATEVDKALWSTPNCFLQLFKSRSIWLAPLNFYEISRLCNISNWSDLQEFSARRNCQGSTLLMPVYFRCADYLVGILPGDDYYPTNTSDHRETIELSLTDAEFKAKTKNLHRITYYDMYDLHVSSNITPIDGHLSPVIDVPNNMSKL